MRRTLLSIVPLLLVLLAPRPAASKPLDKARKLLTRGAYSKAERALRKLARRSAGARLALARLYRETGRSAKAIRAAKRAARGKLRARALTLVAAAERDLGRLAAAERTLKRVLKRKAKHYPALSLLGRVYLEQGNKALAKASFDVFYDDFAADKINKKSAEQLTQVAIACRYSDNFRDAADTFKEATELDPSHVEAYLHWAEISLEKYQAGYAEVYYQKILKLNPNHAAALAGLARVKLVQSYDIKGASKLLRHALRINPKLIDARVVQAEILINAEGNAKAEKLLAAALKYNPRHLAGLSMLAASAYLRDDLPAYNKIKKRVLGFNSRYTAFYRTVMRLGVRHHRYQEAIALGKEALKINPADPYVLADIGTNYLRMGDDKKGLKYLNQAWQGDKYNVRTYNLLNLFDDVLSKHYTFIKSKNFKLRVHKAEAKLLRRTVVPLLERGFAIYRKKYRFKPKTPVVVELYRNPSHFAVRTFGLPPDPGAIGGVCFGQVITSMSPTLRRVNWGQVLWHELNHVFTIQITRSRVPRWFTEGLAVMEPMLYRKEWRRENDHDLYSEIKAGRLAGLHELDTVFTRRSLRAILIAYYQGGVLARFLVKRWGMTKTLKALRQYAKGKRTPQILPAVYGMPLAEIDRRFRAAQLKRLAHYARSWYVDTHRFAKLAAFAKAAKTKPKDARAQAELAVAQLLHRKPKLAQASARKALALDAKQRLALYVEVRLALGRRQAAAAQSAIKRLIAAGGDGYFARLALGRLALQRNDLKRAAAELARAKRFDPEAASPYALLARAYRRAKNKAKVIAELKRLAYIQQRNFGMIASLVQMLADSKDFAGVREYGQIAYYVYPASARLHRLMGRAYEARAPRAHLKRAIWHLETALLCRPKKPAEIHKQLARLYRKRGNRRKAARHAKLAREKQRKSRSP